MRPRLIAGLGVVLTLAAAGAVIVSGGRLLPWSAATSTTPASAAEAAIPAPPAITVAEAKPHLFRDQLFVSGTLVAREEALVGVQIDGLRIAQVLAEDGDRVVAGQVLARLDKSQLDALLAGNDAALARADAAILQARAQIDQTTATLTQARADYERGKQLGLGTISQATLDQRLALAKAGEAQLEGAKSALQSSLADKASKEAERRELQVRIGRTEVRAPVGGLISRRMARVGQLAMGSGEPLFRIIEDGALDLDAEAPDDALARVKVGLPAQIRLGGVDKVWTGRVRLIGSEVDKATRLGRVRVALPPDGPGRIGAFAGAIVEVERREGVAVPASAVTRGEKGRVVQVVKDGRVELRSVETGLVDRELTELTDGVKAGETVVARAAAFLRAGDVIRPIVQPLRESAR